MGDLRGQALGQYHITELIGEGGMATVYRAHQPRLKRDVAIKVMLPALAADPTFRERFEREAQAIANLRHPNILTVHDYGETNDGQLYLVVEYVQGGTLRQQLEYGMPLERAVEILAQMAEALDYAHRQGVIHRDVKPNNILLTVEGRPLLADFGLVKPIEGDRRLTATGMMMGTPDYVAPEQAQGLKTDGRADVYALGVMLFELLTGRHPFQAETPMSVVIKHISEPMPRPSAFNPDLPPALDEIVTRATAKSPDERYQRAGEMARDLRAVLVSGAAPSLGATPATPPTTPPPQDTPGITPEVTPTLTPLPRAWFRRAWVWTALVGVLALVVAAALILPSALSKDEGDRTDAGVPTAQPDETMILIAQFKAETGSERYDVSQRIYERLSEDLRQRGENVSVHKIPDVIESSEDAIALGRRYGATTVIWGYYDDIGISPNVEAVGTLENNPLSVRLERFNLETGEAINFKLYIAKDLPEELSFLTAVSLFQAFILQNQLDKAIEYLAVAESNLPADPQFRGGGETVYFMQAMMAFFQGDLEKASERMDQAIDISPEQALLYTMRGNLYSQMGSPDLALADLERAIQLEPEDSLAYLFKGLVLWSDGQLEAAQRVYEQALEIEPDDLSVYYALGVLGFERGDLTSALEAWRHVEERDPDNPYLPIFRGLIHEKLGRTEEAMADYARAQASGTAPDASIQYVRFSLGGDIPAYSYLFECTAYQVFEQNQRALDSCEEALVADADYFDALWKRGQIHAAEGDLETAVDDFTAAIQVDTSWPWVYYLRAQALAKLGQTDQARADLARAIELNPVDELRQQIENLDIGN